MRADHEREYVEFVTARLAQLHRAAYLLCGDAHRADDLVQVTVTKLYTRWGQARNADNLDGYVHRMLVRVFIDERRLAWSRVRLVHNTPEVPNRQPNQGHADVETRDVVVRALNRLPVGQRTAVVMRYLCDMSVQEVAETMRCSTGNVKSQTARGLALLREVLKSEQVAEAFAVPAGARG